MPIPGQLTPADPEVKKQFETFKNEVTTEATKILSERMPMKILHFSKLVSVKYDGKQTNDPYFKFVPVDIPATFVHEPVQAPNTHNKTELSETQRTKRRKVGESSASTADDTTISAGAAQSTAVESGESLGSSSCGTVMRPCMAQFPAHPQIYIMTEEIKKEVTELIEIASAVKIYIQLNVPRIEGGNNFGVQIQGEAIQELSRVEDAAFGVCGSIVEYFSERGSFAKRIIRFPNVHDFREALREHDEKMWMYLRVTRIDMRNNYAMLYDLLAKNWERVVQPRGSGTSSVMY